MIIVEPVISRRSAVNAAVVLALTLALTLPGAGSSAVIYTDVNCKLEEAIESANTDTAGLFCSAGAGADRIVLTRDAQLTEPATSAVLYALRVTTEITIDGQGFTIRRNDLQDPDDYRLFEVADAGELTLEDVTLVAGHTGIAGPGVALNFGLLRLRNCRVVNTEGTYTGAVENRHVLWVDDCHFQNNSSTHSGAGAITTGNYCRVGLCTAYISRSEFENNSSVDRGGAIVNGPEGYLAVTDSRFYLNESVVAGGAIYNHEGYTSVSRDLFQQNAVTATSSSAAGGAIYNNGGTVTIRNTTFSENEASGPGAIFNYEGAAPDSDGTVVIEQSTFYGNAASSAFTESSTIGGSPRSSTTIEGSIVAGGVGGPDCDPEVTNSGHNFGCGGPAVTNLQPWLSWWGGYTVMHGLLTGSNAIDAGGSCGLPTDQRGIERADPCEAGAYEFGHCADRADNAAAYDTEETVEACQHLWTLGEVLAPDGNVTLRAGRAVILGNGFTVEAGAQMQVEIDPSLLP